MKRKVYFTHILILSFVLSSWSRKIPSSIVSFLFRDFFAIHFYNRAGSCQQTLLVFLLFRMFQFLFYFWVIFSSDIGIWIDNSFLSALKKGCATSFRSPWFLKKNLRHSNYLSVINKLKSSSATPMTWLLNLRLCSLFSKLFSLCYSDWANSIVLSSGSWILPFAPSILLLSPSLLLFFSFLVIAFFSSQVFIWFFFMSFIVGWGFLFLHWESIFSLFQACK